MKTSQHKPEWNAVWQWSIQSDIIGTTEIDLKHDALDNIKSISAKETRSKIYF